MFAVSGGPGYGTHFTFKGALLLSLRFLGETEPALSEVEGVGIFILHDDRDDPALGKRTLKNGCPTVCVTFQE